MRVFLPGTESAGGSLPERRDLQRRDPRKRGWHLEEGGRVRAGG